MADQLIDLKDVVDGDAIVRLVERIVAVKRLPEHILETQTYGKSLSLAVEM